MKPRLFLIVFIFVIIIFQVANSYGIPLYGDPPEDERPLLQILKWASETELKVDENITVHVNITNWSLKTAFNLTIIEPRFSEWTVNNIQTYEKYIYVVVEPNASIYYEYTFQIKNEGDYVIHPTTIDYFDENNYPYFATTYHIELSTYQEEPLVDISDLWENILQISAVIVLIPIVILIVNRVIWRRN